MRLDVYMTENGYCESRKKSSDLIKNEQVFVNGKCVKKPSFDVDENAKIEIIGEVCAFVGRGGLKLLGAIEAFSLDFQDKICADIGSSTGGFTDCMLQHGAKKVYAIDSGKDQLHTKLRTDSRVVCMEGVNARYLDSEMLGEYCDIATMDVSFISQTLLYEATRNILKDGGLFVSLIKPQFEAGREGIGKNGIVKDEKVRQNVIENITNIASRFGFERIGLADSPIYGGDGNKEYLALFRYNEPKGEKI